MCIIVSNYSAVVGICVVTCLTTWNNLQRNRLKIFSVGKFVVHECDPRFMVNVYLFFRNDPVYAVQ